MQLFTVTAPLTIRPPGGGRHRLAERFPHPRGLLYFEPFRRQATGPTIGLIEGPITGDGRWKIGNCVVTVAGCHGSDPELAVEWASWREYLQLYPQHHPTDDAIGAVARRPLSAHTTLGRGRIAVGAWHGICCESGVPAANSAVAAMALGACVAPGTGERVFGLWKQETGTPGLTRSGPSACPPNRLNDPGNRATLTTMSCHVMTNLPREDPAS
ncbi:MAG: hypothetical protein P8076_03005 [Gammaproteobacteria bacterium]